MQKNIADCQRRKSTNCDKKIKISSEIDRLKGEISARASCAAESEKLKAEADKLDLRISGMNELLSDLKTLTQLEREESSLQSLLKERTSEYVEKSKKYESANLRYLKNIAGSLAASLKEGVPCPVCGSAYHPHPAEIEGERVSEEELERLKSERDEADEKAKKYGRFCSAKNAEVRAKREALAASAEKLGCEPCEKDIKEAAALAIKEREKVEKSLFLAKKGEEERKRAEKERVKLENALDSLRKDEEETGGKLEALIAEKAQLDGQKSAFSSLKYSSLEELKTSTERAETEADFAEKRLKNAKEVEKSAAKKLSECKGRIETLTKTAALFSEEKYNETETALKEAEKEIRNLKNKKEELKERGTTNKNTLNHIKDCIATRKREEARYNMIYPLYATAGGNISGKEKVRLETFVQMQYFDRVLLRANMRLDKMTGGQYELIRRESAADKRSQAGLDLDVIDHMNGTVREASTLSGGESFLASLSLALGLSDEIQSGYGGIRIDSMFIDEGFGSLSSDALDSATDTLVSLADGKLSIGIISHVEKLKERIDRQIVVKKCRLGSKAEVKIP